MGIEIERKFLTVADDWRYFGSPTPIAQGYLNSHTDRVVRVRIAGESAYITIKGRTLGAARPEFEYAVPIDDARELLRLCETPIIEKLRWHVLHEGDTWEVDEFFGDNEGLIVAEIELSSEDQTIVLPGWIGEEVTADSRYFNSNLVSKPYCDWGQT